MARLPADFDWDDGNRRKCEKHGVSIGEIETFLRGTPYVAPDHKHSLGEERFLAVGRTATGRPLFVVFALRARDGRIYIRPISARYMHRKEIENYEKKSPDI